MAKIVTIKDKDDVVLYPQTVVGSIFTDDGRSLADDEPTPFSSSYAKSGSIANKLINEQEVTNLVLPVTNRAVFEYGYISNNEEIGETISLDRTELDSWVSAILTCSEGDSISYKGYGAASSSGLAVAWVVLDSEDKILSKSDVGISEGVLVCPANAAKFVFNNYLDSNPYDWYCYKGISSIQNLNNYIEIIGQEIPHYENGSLKIDGTSSSSANWDLSDYIPVETGDIINYKGLTASSATYCAICGYDSAKENPVVLLPGSSGLTVTSLVYVPNGISFVRICSASSEHENYNGSYWRISGHYYDAKKEDQRIEGEIAELESITVSTEEILPDRDRLTDNLSVVDGKVGDWELRFTTGSNSVSKNMDGSFRVSLDINAGVNAAFWLKNILPVSILGKYVVLKVKLRAVSGWNSIMVAGVMDNVYSLEMSENLEEYTLVNPAYTSIYADMRLMFYATHNVVFDIMDISFVTKDSGAQIFPIVRSLEENEITKGIEVPLANFQYKLAQIERGQSAQAVIALLGDSWTQHSWSSAPSHEEEGVYHLHSNYVQPLAKYLRQKYGNAGGGYYSFSLSHIGAGDTKMMSADYDDAWDERSANSSNLITYRDQDEGCMGIDAADTTFNEGAYLTLHTTTPQSAFVIHFYGSDDAGVFSYKLDNELPVQVDASAYSGYSTITVNTTDSTHNLRFDCISGSVMIFGVDMQRSVPGIRIHKIGNKGALAQSYVINDADSWKAGISALNLDSMTILLGTNNGPTGGSVVYSSLIEIANRVRSVNPHIDLQIIQPSNNADSSMEGQVPYQYKAASEINAGFINLVPLFGPVEQINNKGTCTGVHPTLSGGYMISRYLIKKLNLFKI